MGYTDTPEAEVRKLEGVLAARPLVETTPRTGVVYDEPVVTRNVDEFGRIPGVEVETY